MKDTFGPYGMERNENKQKFHKKGASTFAETCLEPDLVNWWVAIIVGI